MVTWLDGWRMGQSEGHLVRWVELKDKFKGFTLHFYNHRTEKRLTLPANAQLLPHVSMLAADARKAPPLAVIPERNNRLINDGVT